MEFKLWEKPSQKFKGYPRTFYCCQAPKGRFTSIKFLKPYEPVLEEESKLSSKSKIKREINVLIKLGLKF